MNPLNTAYRWRRPFDSKGQDNPRPKEYGRGTRSATRENVAAAGVQLTNCPLHKAIYKLQSKDNITGFARRTIFKGFKRLNNTFVQNKKNAKTAFEEFPEKQIQQELQANSINYGKARADVAQAQINRYFKSKGKLRQPLISDKQVIEFAKNMFLSWDAKEGTAFSIDRVVEELISLGVAADSRIISAVVKSFKGPFLTVDEFLSFLKGDKVTAHVSKVLKQIVDCGINHKEVKITKPTVDKKTSFNGNTAESKDRNSTKNNMKSPSKSINYKVGDSNGTVIEVPLEKGSEKVIVHTSSGKGKVAMHFVYDKEGNLVEGKVVGKGKGEKLPEIQKNSGENAIDEINAVKDWWSEIERKSGYKEDIPINIVADSLVEKNIVDHRDKAKQLLGSTLKHSKPFIDLTDFKQLLYKGVFRNLVANLCREVKSRSSSEEGKLPEFLRISNYKKRLLMTAFDPANPEYKQGVKIFERLKTQYERMGKLPVIEWEEEPVVKGKSKERVGNVKEKAQGDYIEIMRKYKKLISTHPEYNEFLVYNA
eukprot:TRINITY_DN14034_c0_g1_i14.p1 TRINITY_DN14034_c0_g1~~TRINITY_DN14034_c0_g1_i14.p1  ORF type:complete len:537 (-),score=141.09 TRINITY_DN14034_c0_g1_i14:133-1743(-)